MLTVGSLFSGIGGIDLGLERTGHFRTVWFSEIDSYANRVLAKHWPNVPNLGNVKEIDYATVTRPDVLVGGYPCQPFSTAGKRLGESDSRHLWPECLRALRELRPRYALFENVRGHLSLGFAQVLSDLAALGFNAEWQVIPACSVGAPHRRDRLFIVAYPNNAGSRTPKRRMDGEAQAHQQYGGDSFNGPGRCDADVANSTSRRLKECESGPQAANDLSQSGATMAHSASGNGPSAKSYGLREVFGQATEFGKSGGATGFVNDWWQVEPDVGRVANGIPSRVDRLRALGNAVVPQVAEMIGYMIAEHANA